MALKRRPESLGGAYELLTESGVQQLVRNLARMAGIERRVYPHLLRHSYITWAIRRGMHPMQIRQIVGHESTAMIDRVYTHLVPQDAYAAMVKALADVEEDWRISFGSTSDRIRIREANQADTRRLVDVHHRTVLVAYAGIFPPNSPEPRPDALQRQWELAFTDPTFRALLAEEDQGGAVATVAVRSDPDISGSGELCRLHVLPGWWGSGVGTVLHDAALTALRTAGYAQAGLWVLRDNRRARAFYERRGWQLVEGEVLALPDAGVIEVRYRRRLPACVGPRLAGAGSQVGW